MLGLRGVVVDVFGGRLPQILRPSLAEDSAARRTMACEADLLHHLQHPVIVRALDVVMDGPHPHLMLDAKSFPVT